jgi:hypothetical protein
MANLFEVGGGPACQSVLAGLVAEGRRFRSLLELMNALEAAWSERQTRWMSLLRDPLLQQQQEQQPQDSFAGFEDAGDQDRASEELGAQPLAGGTRGSTIDDLRFFPGFEKSDFIRTRE